VPDIFVLPAARSQCRSTWATNSSAETDAPEHRIIHSRFANFGSPTTLKRLGVKSGFGYFKCGSRTPDDDEETLRRVAAGDALPVGERDFVQSLRVLVWDGSTWITKAAEPQLEPSSDPFWADLGCETTAILAEIRRSDIDGWWPSWNLATSAFELEGGTPVLGPREERRLEQGSVNPIDQAGVSHTQVPGEVRFTTRFIEIGFSLHFPRLMHLGIDAEGKGRTNINILKAGGFFPFYHHPLRTHLAHGTVLERVGRLPDASHAVFRMAGRVDVAGSGVKYTMESSDGGQEYEIEWTLEEDRVGLEITRRGRSEERAFDSAAWRLVTDSQLTQTSAMGTLTRAGQTGTIEGPFLWHVPGQGTLAISEGPGVLWRTDSIRPLLANSLEVKLGEVPQPEGDYLLMPGVHHASIELRVQTPSFSTLRSDAPPIIRDLVDKVTVSAVSSFRPDTGTLSNNGASMHALTPADSWGALFTQLKSDPAYGPEPSLFLKYTVERWLDGGPAYGAGRTFGTDRVLEDEYLMTGTNALVGVGELLRSQGEQERGEWWSTYSGPVRAQLKAMAARDLDGDGLIESDLRLGISGSHEWSTNWWDIISFGWKDAFSNALLCHALDLLSTSIPTYELEDRELAASLSAWRGRLRASYPDEFFNPDTGWLAGWRSKDGVLHDYCFVSVNGAAVAYGAVNRELGADILARVLEQFRKSGFDGYRFGLPGNLFAIPDEDLVKWQAGFPFGYYLNGGVTHSQARHFLNGLYAAGLVTEADEILVRLAKGLVDRDVLGGCGSGIDWHTWDGRACGYEGQLTDQFGVIATAIDRFGLNSKPRI
jgi:hypothetical protein